MELFKKAVAIVSVFALIITSVAFTGTLTKGADYSGLNYKDITNNGNSEFDQKLKGAQYAISSGSSNIGLIQFQNQAFGELYVADGGWTADQLKATVNGKNVTTEGSGIRISNAASVLTNKYNELAVTWNGGSALIIIKCPAIEDGQQVTTEQISESSNPGETITTKAGGESVTTQSTEDSTHPSASSLPKKAAGVSPQVSTDQYSIDNAVLLAWSSVMESANPQYDSSVYTYNAYIYKNGTVISKICNVTNGCILGGLSAGTYGFAVAAVNSMGEGPKSDVVNATVTGVTLNYAPKSEYTGPKIPGGFVIVSADENFKATKEKELQKNTMYVAWAASNADTLMPSYDTTVTGYNVYVFDADTGNPYRRVHVDGIDTNTAILKDVSAGNYVCFVTAVSPSGESGMAAPGLSLASSVTIEGDVIDNAQAFDLPDQPVMPESFVINGLDEGVGDGFSVAWSPEVDFDGLRVNIFVDGVCVKAGASTSGDPTYHEQRLKPGTYKVQVTLQYTSNNVESMPLTKTVKVASTTGTSTPEELADPSYSGYEPETTLAPTTTAIDDTTKSETTTVRETTTSMVRTTTAVQTTQPAQTTSAVKTTKEEIPSNNPAVETTKSGDNGAVRPSLGRTKVTKATKKKSAKKASIKLKKVAGAVKYQVKYGIGKKMSKSKSKFVKKLTFKLKGLKKKKKYYVMARAVGLYQGKAYYGAWSAKKLIKMK